jgi:hypothetical protein
MEEREKIEGFLKALDPSKVREFRLVRERQKSAIDGRKMESAIEMAAHEGHGEIRYFFAKYLDLEDTYFLVSTFALGKLGVATLIREGRKGKVEGKFRRDRVQGTLVLGDGSVHPLAEMEVYVPTAKPFGWMSPAQAASEIRSYLADTLRRLRSRGGPSPQGKLGKSRKTPRQSSSTAEN